MEKKYDLIIIGGGPGGTDAAEAAAKRGLKTAIVEKSAIGGTCLNRGCIPTKTILHTAGIYREAKNGGCLGLVNQEGLKIDAAVLQDHKNEILEKLRDGLTYTMEHCKVDIIEGTGTILDSRRIKVGERLLETERILIASGSTSMKLPIEGSDLPNVVTSDELLASVRVPDSMVIIGGGVIGMEFAAIYSDFGCRVTVLESLKRVLDNFDKEIGRSIAMILSKRNVDIHTEAKVNSIARADDEQRLICEYEEKGNVCRAEGELVLIAAGRSPYVECLFSDESSSEVKQMKREHGYIAVNDRYETSVPGIYAIGDVTGGIQLAHAASAEGVNAVACMAGDPPPFNLDLVPSCVYTEPEIASVGLTADLAKAAGRKVITRKYPMGSNGKSVLTMQERGFIKIIADAESEKVLGAQLMCARATDMITQFSQAIAAGLSLNHMAEILYPHPSFCEGIGKAAAK
ncbi:dihydrolipoyl dehydrogenase [Anaerovorax odorimutans]|uniref:Dihydrolipoyl dehydrogenase n=1 Tax=Anaerovorax odorimutans TaxID=109327 RepID=A0ABT1RQZ6_9FIRM|nr:dihydrolipoyl dehydrogenase [Anaerovorax odorimutans]MCQ4637610.1 dihydrolipoyl dehydrogenase [Anaerovorax odorimutans]